jgi:hypothetical protein
MAGLDPAIHAMTMQRAPRSRTTPSMPSPPNRNGMDRRGQARR